MFKVGDRVRLVEKHSALPIPIGSIGTIDYFDINTNGSKRAWVFWDSYFPEKVHGCYICRLQPALRDGNQLLLFEVD